MGAFEANIWNIRKLLNEIPENFRLVLLTAMFGVVAGLVTVAFMQATNFLFVAVWHRLAAANATSFLIGSLPEVGVGPAEDVDGKMIASTRPRRALLKVAFSPSQFNQLQRGRKRLSSRFPPQKQPFSG